MQILKGASQSREWLIRSLKEAITEPFKAVQVNFRTRYCIHEIVLHMIKTQCFLFHYSVCAYANYIYLNALLVDVIFMICRLSFDGS